MLGPQWHKPLKFTVEGKYLLKYKLEVTSGERERGRGNTGAGGEERIIMGLYEIIYVKLLKIVKHYRI